MRTHRAARLVAILLFVVAAVYFLGGLFVGLSLWSRGLGEGWGSGFAGWISIPILLGAFFGALVLLLFGAILYFLAQIDSNLSEAKARMKALKAEAKAEAELPQVKAEAKVGLPKVELPAVAAELPKVKVAAPKVELPEVKAGVELPKVEVVAPQIEAPAVELPKVDVVAPAVELPAVQVTAPRVEVTAPELELPQVEAELPEIDIDAAPKEFSGKLPGLEEAARIASEMAASEGPRQPND